MLNSAASRDFEVAPALRDLYRSVLDTLVSLIASEDGTLLPSAVRNVHGGRTLTWRASGAVGPADFLRYFPLALA